MTIKSRSFAVIGLFISASLLSFGDTITQAPALAASGSVTQQPTEPPEFTAIRKAAAAYDPINKPESFDAVYKAVVGQHHKHRVDDDSAKLLKPILSSYEKAYWQGKHPGIDEADIVNLVNTFADNHKLPEIAKTTQSQVHYLRMKGIIFGAPEVQGKGVKLRKDEATGKLTTGSTKMSPLQAFDLVEALMDSKEFNTEFQKTPEDWEKYFKAKKPGDVQAKKVIGISKYSPEGISLNTSLTRAFNSMTTADAISLVSKTLNWVNSR